MLEVLENIKKSIDDNAKDIKMIKENHLFHIEKDLATTRADVSWVKRIVFITLGATISTLIASVINLI